MALYEKRDKMPPHLAEIPYGFKNLWLITVSELDLTGQKFLSSNIARIILNGANVTADQLNQLYDYNRDGCTLMQASSTTGLYVTLTDYDRGTGVYSFQTLVGQMLEIYGVIGVSGGMVDNTDPMRPVIGHDKQKLDVAQHDDDLAAIADRLATDEERIQANTDNIADLVAGTITGVSLNGVNAPVDNGVARISIDYVTPEEQADAFAAKVDKDVAGDGNCIVQEVADTFDAETRELSISQTLLSLEDGTTQNVATTYALADLLGITDLESIDKELHYFCPASLITSFTGSINVSLSDLYGLNADGSAYMPSASDHIRLVFAVSQDYSGYGVLARTYISAIGKVSSRSADALICAFTNLQQLAIYNKYNGYQTNTLVYDTGLKSIFQVLQTVPVPTTEANTIAITNMLYYEPIKDLSRMPAGTVWANLESEANEGRSYTMAETRKHLLQLGAGYDEYVSFIQQTIPAQILTNADWMANISLWVTDGIHFTSLSALLDYLSNFQSPDRYMISNRGIIMTRYEEGGIVITPAFALDSIRDSIAGAYQPLPYAAATGNLAAFDSNMHLVDSGLASSGLATAGQGAKADTAIQAVELSSGDDNGTVKLTVDGNDQIVQIANLGSAAFADIQDIASAGIRKVQSVTPSSGIAVIDLADNNIRKGNIFKIAPASAVSVVVSNSTIPDGVLKEFEIHISMGDTAHAVTWFGGLTWLGGTPSFEANRTVACVFRASAGNAFIGNPAYAY